MYRIVIKRLIDILFSLVLLPFLLIVIILIAPLIYLNDRGPVFYNAERIGKMGKKFKMYKFRSMKTNAPDLRNEDGSTYNSDDDSRVTGIGKILRKTSLDEFPQILNVLKGNMSIIGPRPTVSTKPFNEIDEKTKKRYFVRPGITGYAQAYYRNSISQKEKFDHDIFYVENISFWLDFKIFFKTIKTVLFREKIHNKK